MLFKQYLLEGRPFYDEQGNKYVASKNDHYSKNGEEITKQEYDRIVHAIKASKEKKPKKEKPIEKVNSTPSNHFDKTKDDPDKYISQLLPEATIDLHLIKDKDNRAVIAEGLDSLFTKYPKFYEFAKRSWLGDSVSISKKVDEINKKSIEDFNKLPDNIKQSVVSQIQEKMKNVKEVIPHKIWYDKMTLKDYVMYFISEEEADLFILHNHYIEDVPIKEALDDKELENDIIKEVIKKTIKIDRKFPSPAKNCLGYYLFGTLPSQRGVILNKNAMNNYIFEQEPDNYDDFHLDVTSRKVTLKTALIHEYGHMLDSMLNLHYNPEIEKLWNENQSKIADEVSTYATKEIREFIAECFAEYHLSGSPRELPRKVGEIIDKLMGL